MTTRPKYQNVGHSTSKVDHDRRHVFYDTHVPLVSGGEEDIGDFPLDCLGCCCLDFPCVASVGMLLSDETAGSFAEGPTCTCGFCSAEDRDGFFVSETDEQASGFSSGFDAGELALAAGIFSSLANW